MHFFLGYKHSSLTLKIGKNKVWLDVINFTNAPIKKSQTQTESTEKPQKIFHLPYKKKLVKYWLD